MFEDQVFIEGKNYLICGTIGQGGAGVVYLARDRQNKSYALKMVREYNNPVVKQMVDAEIKIQKTFKGNQYVIQYIGVQKMQKRVYIVLQLGEYSLRNAIQIRQMMQRQLINMICDVCHGLHDIHLHKIIHRDIKPQNVIFKDGIFKITDFGVSAEKQQDQSVIGTILYWAPQMLFQQKQKFTSKVDVWSLGVTAFQSYFKINPFCPSTKNLTQKQILDQLKKNIRLLTPEFTMRKLQNFLRRRNFIKEWNYIQRRLARTNPDIVKNICSLFEPDPEKRNSSDIVLALFESLREAGIGQIKCKKTKLNPKYTYQSLPQDIKMFCRAKNLFYQMNAQIKSKVYDKTLLGMQLAIWYLQGANYAGIHYVYLDSIKTIIQYKQPRDILWKQVFTYLSQYYFQLTEDEQAIYFEKIKQLKLLILVCSVWIRIINSTNYCSQVSKIIGMEIMTEFQLFQFLPLISQKKFKELEELIIKHYYSA